MRNMLHNMEVTYIHSYIPQTKQHELKGQMLFSLWKVIYLLDVAPSKPLLHQLSPPLCVI